MSQTPDKPTKHQSSNTFVTPNTHYMNPSLPPHFHITPLTPNALSHSHNTFVTPNTHSMSQTPGKPTKTPVFKHLCNTKHPFHVTPPRQTDQTPVFQHLCDTICPFHVTNTRQTGLNTSIQTPLCHQTPIPCHTPRQTDQTPVFQHLCNTKHPFHVTNTRQTDQTPVFQHLCDTICPFHVTNTRQTGLNTSIQTPLCHQTPIPCHKHQANRPKHQQQSYD